MLLCGQVTTFTLEFVNIGFKTIRTIYLTFNKPQLFSLVLKPLNSRATTNVFEDGATVKKNNKEEMPLKNQDLNNMNQETIKNSQTLKDGFTKLKVTNVEEWLKTNANKKSVIAKENRMKPIPPFRDPKIVYSFSSCGTLLTGNDQEERVLDFKNIFIESDEDSNQAYKNFSHNNNNNNNNEDKDDANTNCNNATKMGCSAAGEREYGTVPSFPVNILFVSFSAYILSFSV